MRAARTEAARPTIAVTDLRERFDEHLSEIARSAMPVAITRGRRTVAVAMSKRVYREYAAALEQVRTIRAVAASRREVKAGHVSPWRKARARLLASAKARVRR